MNTCNSTSVSWGGQTWYVWLLTLFVTIGKTVGGFDACEDKPRILLNYQFLESVAERYEVDWINIHGHISNAIDKTSIWSIDQTVKVEQELGTKYWIVNICYKTPAEGTTKTEMQHILEMSICECCVPLVANKLEK